MFNSEYINWRTSMMNGMKKCISPEYFKSKTLMEIGCRDPDIGNMFSELGATVTCSDTRQEHLDGVKERYPHIKTLLIDGDNYSMTDKHDILIHWDVLYHLNEIELHLEKLSQKCDVLLLETEVSDSDDSTFYISTGENDYNNVFNINGIRPSPSYVESILTKNGFQYKLINDSILNNGFNSYDWDISNCNGWINGLRRFWICWKNVESPLVDI